MGGKNFFLDPPPPPLIRRSGWLPPPPPYLKVWIRHWTIPNIVGCFPNIVGCYMLYPSAHPVACCCVLLGVVMQSLKPVKLLSLQLPTFVLFCNCQSISNNVGSVCTALPTLFGPRTCITHGLQSLMGCIMMHSGSNIVGGCCIHFPNTTNKDATAPNIVGKVHEWFFDSRTTALLVTKETKIELILWYCLLLFAIFIT